MPLGNVQLHLVDSFDEAWEFSRWLEGRDWLAADTETTGLIIGQDRVRLIQVGGLDAGWAIPLERWGGLFEDLVVRRFCASPQHKIYMHNAKFDAGMLSHHHIHIPRNIIHDTRVMSHILEPNMSTALKNQAARHIDQAAAVGQTQLDSAMKTSGWTWETVPVTFDPYWQYAALDTVLTAHLAMRHEPLVLADAPDAYDTELAYTWVTERMERYGAFVDVDYARQKFNAFTHYVDEADEWVRTNFKVKSGSNAAIIKILQDAGFEFDKKTASGALSLDKNVLGHIDHPLAQTILQRRQLQKLASTYLYHFINEIDEHGRIHPSINTLGTRTSRCSMERPNLQNLPRRSEENKASITVRNCFRSRYHESGGTMLMCDFDQIEMRGMAVLSRDSGLIAAFHSPDDFFINLARMIFNDPNLSEKKDPRRQITKNAGYATIYGAGVAKSAATAGVSEDQMRAVRKRWDELYPGTKRLAQEIERVAWERQRSEGVPYVRCPLTGRRQVGDHNKIYALVNYLIQGWAAALFKKKQIALDAAGLGEYMVIPVHDEIVLDCPVDVVRDAVDTLHKVMNDYDTFAVPISASVSYGERWGEKRDWVDAA